MTGAKIAAQVALECQREDVLLAIARMRAELDDDERRVRAGHRPSGLSNATTGYHRAVGRLIGIMEALELAGIDTSGGDRG